MEKLVVMSAGDNVATCLLALKNGETATLTVNGKQSSVAARGDIPFGHKVALVDIAAGDNILKYAEVIGIASRTITAGEHVHVHNVESIRARGDKAGGGKT